MDLSGVDTLELIDRVNFLSKEYSQVSVELAKKLDEYGKLKKELQLILVELEGRNELPEGADLEEALKKLEETDGEEKQS